MGAMVRKQIYISERQQALVERMAKQRGVSQAELIRQAIDREVAAVEIDPAARERAWRKAEEFMLSLDRRATGREEPYRWSREELYEDRGLPRALRVSDGGRPDDTDRH